MCATILAHTLITSGGGWTIIQGESFLMRSLLVTIIQAYFNGAKAEITIEIWHFFVSNLRRGPPLK